MGLPKDVEVVRALFVARGEGGPGTVTAEALLQASSPEAD